MFLPVYLNYAGLAPIPPRVYLAGLAPMQLLGNLCLPSLQEEVAELKGRIADWLGCEPRQIALYPSTSLALRAVAFSLPLQSGDLLVYPNEEFAANVMPWGDLAARGIRVKSQPLEGEALLPETKFLSISTVNYRSGAERPWREYLAQASAQSTWTCLDAIQSAGIKDCSPIASVDFWVTGTQKWLVAGLGLAILVLSERALRELKPALSSWLSLTDPPNIASGLCPDARAWEAGWVTPEAVKRANASLKMLEKIGWEKISLEVKARRDLLYAELLNMGYPIATPYKNWSGIVSLGPFAEEQAQALLESGYKRKIITARRGQYLRLSAHYLNPWSDLEQALKWLSDER